MDWFEKLTGFVEATGQFGYEQNQQRLKVEGDQLVSLVNGERYGIGTLELVSLTELRRQVQASEDAPALNSFRIVEGDVRQLHQQPSFQGALFQVASQFNLLEMVGPSVTPEHGVTRYAHDHTQGPACAIAAGAATIYRNYFAPVGQQVGQTRETQLDGFAALAAELAQRLGIAPEALLTMQNGYAMFRESHLSSLSDFINEMTPQARDQLKGLLRIGLHWDVEVTASAEPRAHVSQAFCSALPVSYNNSGFHGKAPNWQPLAALVLEAAFEATLLAAVLNTRRKASCTVLLTMLGGGAFGNDTQWICDAIKQALLAVKGAGLDVVLVSYGSPSTELLKWNAHLVSALADQAESLEAAIEFSESETDVQGSPEQSGQQPSLDELTAAFKEVAPDSEDRLVVLGQLLASVRYCEAIGSSAWSVSLIDRGFRLNVGEVEAMTCQYVCWDAVEFGLVKDFTFFQLRLLLSGPSASAFVDAKDTDADKMTYRSVGADHWCASILLPIGVELSSSGRSTAVRQLLACQEAHQHFVRRAAHTPTGKLRVRSKFARFHRPEMIQLAQRDTQDSLWRWPFKFIPNEALLPEHIPANDAAWRPTISNFALAHSGDAALYRSVDVHVEQTLNGRPKATLTELRDSLYRMQRSWRWNGREEDPDESEMIQVQGLLDAIRERVLAGQLD